MPSRGSRCAVEHATRFLRHNLDKSVWKEGECLPSTRRLSTMASVSRATMLKAIAILSAEGLLSASERYRVRVGGDTSIVANTPDPRLPSHKVRTLFERELLAGAFGHRSVLPTLRELQGRYGVSYGTMKRIMRSLAADGVIEPHGRGYRIPSRAVHSVPRRVVFVTMQDHLAQMSALNMANSRIANLFERECRRLGMHMEVVEVDFFDPARTRAAVRALTDDDSITGYVFDVWWYEQPRHMESYGEVLNRLASFHKPVALLDEMGNFDLPAPYNVNPLMQLFTIETTRAGKRMARFLVEKGHRACAYISCFHNTTWCQKRFAGAVEQFAEVGYPEGVHLAVCATEDSLMYQLRVLGLADVEMSRWIRLGRTPAQAADFGSRWNEYVKSAPPELLTDPRDRIELRENLAPLQLFMRQSIPDDLLLRLSSAVIDTGSILLGRMLFRSMFERALERRDATAWICANDLIAFEALRFLKSRGTSVPGDISVVGFDNTPTRALEEQLTSLDFNALGFVDNLLGFILHPRQRRGPYRHSTIEVEGIIIERGSTRGGRGDDARGGGMLPSQHRPL